MTLDELITDFPRLYHMAEGGSWEGISTHGLLSTAAILDLFETPPQQRAKIETCHRPVSVSIKHPKHGLAVIRDQKPMSDSGLNRCLSGSTPAEWYKCLNGKVFLWLSQDRLHRLLKAQLYRQKIHDVLTLDTRTLVEKYSGQILLSPMNSGCTTPFPHPRDSSTFKSISEYPYRERRRTRSKNNALVELTVEYSVPDILSYVIQVNRMKGDRVIERIWPPA
jgi:hypothetical protein